MPNKTTPQVTTTTYVEYLLPGVFMPEVSIVEVDDRNPSGEARVGPKNAYAFSYFDVVTTVVEVDGEEIETSSDRLNPSGKYFIDAELLDSAAVRALPGDHDILLGNMRNAGWDPILCCRTGNFQPFDPVKDQLISS